MKWFFTGSTIFWSLVALPTSAQQLGVPVCDEFLTKYEACMAKQGAAIQGQYSQMITQWRASWKTLADNPQTKPTLENICKQQLEAVKAQFNAPPLNCGF